MGLAEAMELRLLTYLSPGLPLALFGAVADHLRRCPELGGREIALASAERVSGPELEAFGLSRVVAVGKEVYDVERLRAEGVV